LSKPKLTKRCRADKEEEEEEEEEEEIRPYVISDFRRGANRIFDLPDGYSTWIAGQLPTFRETYPSQLQEPLDS
jgi:hypothetical protein